jgi:hypothetical protein
LALVVVQDNIERVRVRVVEGTEEVDTVSGLSL